MTRIISALTLFLIPTIAFAQYTPIVGVPGVSGGDFDGYVNAVYALAISLAALLAVIKIVIAGVKWMMTDVVTSKGDAKADIRGALFGLLIILAAVLILTIINEDITEADIGGGITRLPERATTPVDTPGDYDITYEDGYSYILVEDTSSVDERDFRENCPTGNITYEGTGTARQMRCITPTTAQTTAIESLVPAMDATERAAFVEQYSEFVTPVEIDADDLAAAHAVWEAEVDVTGTTPLFGIDVAQATVYEEGQFRTLVQQIEQSENAQGFIVWEEVDVPVTSPDGTTGTVRYLIAVDARE